MPGGPGFVAHSAQKVIRHTWNYIFISAAHQVLLHYCME